MWDRSLQCAGHELVVGEACDGGFEQRAVAHVADALVRRDQHVGRAGDERDVPWRAEVFCDRHETNADELARRALPLGLTVGAAGARRVGVEDERVGGARRLNEHAALVFGRSRAGDCQDRRQQHRQLSGDSRECAHFQVAPSFECFGQSRRYSMI